MRWTNEEKFNKEVEFAADRFNVPPNLILAFIGHESGFKPTAVRNEPAINDKSIGLMQILYGTAKGEGFTGTEAELFEPATNIYYGTSYLARQLARAGNNTPNAISAYNGGWRPEIGFGAVATRPLTICLARDQVTGQCIKTRNVPIGEYSNQEYVLAILKNYGYFQSKPQTQTPPTTGGGGIIPAPTTYQATSVTPKIIGALVALLLALFGLKFAGK